MTDWIDSTHSAVSSGSVSGTWSLILFDTMLVTMSTNTIRAWGSPVRRDGQPANGSAVCADHAAVAEALTAGTNGLAGGDHAPQHGGRGDASGLVSMLIEGPEDLHTGIQTHEVK